MTRPYHSNIKMDTTMYYEKPLSDYRRNERQEMLIAAPLDLSFKKATTMNGMLVI